MKVTCKECKGTGEVLYFTGDSGYDKCIPCDGTGKIDVCRNCGCELRDKNSKDVGYCLPCFAEMMSDEEE